ncbi:MAG: energy-coupling factor transporter ATPase [Rhodoglobus sp.]|nr:energy-coupling factor transporter ATPase [Rhodoglobus sp.]
MPLIDIRNVTWRYGEDLEPALRDVSLAVNAGEFLGIMGATGAGKSSLAQAIRGIIPSFHEEGVFEGEVVVDGVNVTGSDAQHTAREIGMVFQDASSQIIGTTVLQDVTFGPANLGLDRGTILERSRAYLSRVRLAGREQRASSALSGGQIQRLAIAGVLAMEPGVLVLDEPVAELDPVGRREVCEILEELKSAGKATVVLIEQDPELISHFADRVAIMAHGRIELVGTPREVFRQADACLALGVYPPEAALLSEAISSSTVALTAPELLESITLDARAALPAPAARPSPEQGEVVLELRDLSFAYKADEWVVNKANLQVRSGEYLAIVGSNGAGKTTLVKHLNGLRRPTVGTVLVNGRDIAKRETADIAQEVGFCFQNPDHQIFASTVLEEAAFGLTCRGVSPDEARPQALEMLKRFGIGDLTDANPHSLGKGQRQKIALASIVVLEPKILVIDEPTTGLDWAECQQILDIIDTIRDGGTTVVAVTHDMRLVRERASRAVAMSRGEIIYDGGSAEFFSEDELMRRADVEPTTLSVLTREIAASIGVDVAAMPVSVADFVRQYGPALTQGKVA